MCVFQWNSIVQLYALNHWGRVSHTLVDHLTIIGSDNVLSPGRRQTIIWTSAGILLTGLLKTNFSEILFEIHIFPLTKMHLKMSYAKCSPFCPCFHGLINTISKEYEPKHVTPCYYLPQTRRVCISSGSKQVRWIVIVHDMFSWSRLQCSDERHDVSNRRPPESLFNSLLKLTTKNNRISTLLATGG